MGEYDLPTAGEEEKLSGDGLGDNNRHGDRLSLLSQPKPDKTEWLTRFGPVIQWGTQDQLWPVSQTAMKAEASDRVRHLATPKPNHQRPDMFRKRLFEYSCGRSSALWDVDKQTMEALCSDRFRSLAEPKRLHQDYSMDRREFLYSCGRPSPIWQMPGGPLACPDRERTNSLALPKLLHRDYVGNRQVQTEIPETALRATSSTRTSNLAAAKNRDEGPFRDPEWPVTKAAKNASASGRSLELAKPKPLTEGYQPQREVEWVISRAARRAATNQRLNGLAMPIIRASMDHVQFNPEAFFVKQSALKGVIPKRIHDLAQPVAR